MRYTQYIVLTLAFFTARWVIRRRMCIGSRLTSILYFSTFASRHCTCQSIEGAVPDVTHHCCNSQKTHQNDLYFTQANDLSGRVRPLSPLANKFIRLNLSMKIMGSVSAIRTRSTVSHLTDAAKHPILSLRLIVEILSGNFVVHWKIDVNYLPLCSWADA